MKWHVQSFLFLTLFCMPASQSVHAGEEQIAPLIEIMAVGSGLVCTGIGAYCSTVAYYLRSNELIFTISAISALGSLYAAQKLFEFGFRKGSAPRLLLFRKR